MVAVRCSPASSRQDLRSTVDLERLVVFTRFACAAHRAEIARLERALDATTGSIRAKSDELERIRAGFEAARQEAERNTWISLGVGAALTLLAVPLATIGGLYFAGQSKAQATQAANARDQAARQKAEYEALARSLEAKLQTARLHLEALQMIERRILAAIEAQPAYARTNREAVAALSRQLQLERSLESNLGGQIDTLTAMNRDATTFDHAANVLVATLSAHLLQIRASIATTERSLLSAVVRALSADAKLDANQTSLVESAILQLSGLGPNTMQAIQAQLIALGQRGLLGPQATQRADAALRAMAQVLSS